MERPQQLTIGVDLGGTSTRIGLFDAGMHLVDSRRMRTDVDAGPQACVTGIATAIDALLAAPSLAKAQVAGIGIGSPGPINLRTGVLSVLPNLPGWDFFPLRDALAEATGLPTTLESDANAAAIAEWKLGAGRAPGLDSMAMILLGTGVGSGLILAGRVWHGMFGMGGEVGHTTIDPSGPLCGCGTRGCLETYASATGLVRIAREIAAAPEGSGALSEAAGSNRGLTAEGLAELAGEGDPGAMLAFQRLGHSLGIGIANLINTLDLPMIVVGGGVAKAWDLFAPAMFESVRRYSTVYRLVAPTQYATFETDRTFIRPALLGPAAGLMGAAMLPRMDPPVVRSSNISLSAEMTR